MAFKKLSFSLPESVESQLVTTVENWEGAGSTERIWQKDAAVWTNSGENKWLGWLNIAADELAKLDEYRDLREDVAAAGFADIVLMGMGGSSLGPEVLATTFGIENFHILDSTVPAQVRSVEARVDLAKTLFIVASKSGTTLEPNCFMLYFFDRIATAVGRESAGQHFIAITDPGSKLEEEARELGFRKIIHGKPDVGGRFSALSPFGMAPAAVMGLDVESILTRAAAMAAECRNAAAAENPGALLGIILGVCHAAGRDKLTIFASKELESLGAWLEQLIAESTGKNGAAIIPIDGEAPQPTVSYGPDRVFVDIRLAGGNGADVDLSALRAAGHPVLQIEMADVSVIGAEFFRWEFATAAAGAVMGLNPFDQPDVEAAKIETRSLTDAFESSGSLPDEETFFEAEGIKMFASAEYAAHL
ncbi:MAG: transaldolase, partial [Blastocatellia bacterium]|nr:transaldolase [Blastocatellia bacterium]